MASPASISKSDASKQACMQILGGDLAGIVEAADAGGKVRHYNDVVLLCPDVI